jgi:hypothetical protein
LEVVEQVSSIGRAPTPKLRDTFANQGAAMGPVIIAAFVTLFVLVMALAGSLLARKIATLMVGLTAAALLAIW